MACAAGAAGPADGDRLAAELTLDLLQLKVNPLELGCATGEHIKAHVIADRHLVQNPAQLSLACRKTLGEAVAPREQLGITGAQDGSLLSRA